MKVGEVIELAATLRQQASSRMAVDRFVRRLDNSREREVAYAALAYALCQIQGELVVRKLGGHVPTRWRNAQLADQQRTLMQVNAVIKESCLEARRQRVRRVPPPEVAPNHLAALVMQQFDEEAFGGFLQPVLHARGLPSNAFRFPSLGGLVYAWAEANGLIGAPPSLQVKQLLAMNDSQFIAELLTEANGRRGLPDHPAIVDRRMALGKELDKKLQAGIREAERSVQRQPLRGRSPESFRKVLKLYQVRGRFLLHQRMAEAEEAEFRAGMLLVFRGRVFMQERAACLQEAATAMGKANPELRAAVTAVVSAHQRQCPEASRPFPCARCAPGLVEAVRTRHQSSTVRTRKGSPSTASVTTVTKIGSEAASRTADTADGRSAAAEGKPLVVAVDAKFDDQSNLAGLAWVAEDGQVGAALEQASSAEEATLRAVCRAWNDLRVSGHSLSIRCGDTGAVREARRMLEHQGRGAPAASPGFAAGLIGYGHRVTVTYSGGLRSKSRHGKVAAELASLARSIARGSGRHEEVAAWAVAASKRLGGTGTAFLALHEGAAGSRLLGPEDGIADPEVTRTRSGSLTWKQVLRAEHLSLQRCPLPTEVWRSMIDTLHDGQKVLLVVQHDVQPSRGNKATREVRAELWEGYLSLLRGSWPGYFFPGMIVDCSWTPARKRLTVSPRRLPRPIQVNGRTLTHHYDARVFTRDTAPGGWLKQTGQDLNVEQWVLRTLQILGYLDPLGRALLTEDALTRNMIELGFPSRRLGSVETTVERLIKQGELRRVPGSLDQDGHPVFPARPHQPSIQLLCHEPRVDRSQQGDAQMSRPTGAKRSSHQVSGFVRKLPQGQAPTRDALDAHTEARRQAELADDKPLPAGYTFVRRHRRGR